MKTMKKIVAILAVALMLCSILPLSVFAADTYELASSIEVGDTVILVCEAKKMELNGISTTGTKYGLGVAYSSAPVGAYVLTVEAGSTSDTYAFKTTDGKYLYWSSGNSLTTNATKSANSSWKVTFSGTSVTIANGKDNARKLQWNASSPRFACYTTSQTAVSLYKKAAAEPEVPSDCEHDWELISTTPATCTTAGEEHYECAACGESKTEAIDALGHNYGEATETVAPDCTNAGEQESTCSVCGDVKTETVNALGHNYVDGFCSVCGEAQPLEITIPVTAITGTLAGDSSSISWQADGFQFITYKSGSTSAIRVTDSDHFRVYAKNKVEVSSQNGQLLKKVQFNATTTDYATVLSQQTAEGWTASVDGTVVTFTSVNGAESLIINSVSAQVRINSVIVTPYVTNCEHDYVGVETQAPTCSAEGVMTYTCSKCQESYTEAIATIPHSYVEDIIDSTCTTTGTATYECSVCGHSYNEEIAKKPHNYVDDVCADCGTVKAYKGTIDFSNAEQRTELTTQIQIWANEGLTFTNNKLTGNNIADYTNPIRIYKNSGIVIEFSEMSKLIIDANGIGNDYLWDATLEAAGLSFTVANGIYTITFAEAVNSLELTCANQVRANSITAIVAHECVYDHACDADCNKCGETREVADHVYADAFDTTCDVCGVVRSVVAPATACGFSRSEDVRGLAVRFEIPVNGMGIDVTTAIYDNAYVNGYKLISMGAIASNGVSQKDIPAVYLCNDDVSTSAKFAIRIINIPEGKEDVQVTFTPYVIVEIDGEQVTIYGEAVSSSFNG